MLMSLLQSFKKHSVSGALFGSVVLLTACGGGGGGGGGGGVLPTKVAVESPAKDSSVTDSSAPFEVSFDSSVSDSSSVEIILNNVDVTAQFTPTTGTANRTASVYSLSGLFKEGDKANCITVKLAGSSNSGACFTYDAKPEVILTTLEGAGPFTANGVTRQATLASVTLTSIVDGIISGAVPSAHVFSVPFDTFPVAGSDVTTNPDFTLLATDADGDSLTTRHVVPKARFHLGAAVQLNNTAFDVVESWVGDVMGNQLNEVFTSFVADPLPHADVSLIEAAANDQYNDLATPALLDSVAANDGLTTACAFLNAVRTSDFTECRLYVNAITTTGLVTTNVTIKDSGAIGDDTVPVEVKVTFAQLNITLDTAAFLSDVYQGAMVTELTFHNATFTLNLHVYKATGTIASFVLDSTTPMVVKLTPSLPPTVVSNYCNVCDSAPDSAVINAAVPTLESQILAKAGAYTTKINNALAKASVDDVNKTYLVGKDTDNDPATTPDAVSTLNFALTGSEVAEAKSGAGVVGAFIGLGGSTYAEDDAFAGTNDLPAIGSYFDPLGAAFAGTRSINAGSDVMIALSENSLNQLLLGVYQSRLPNMEKVTFQVKDLGVDANTNGVGDLGEQIITLTAQLGVPRAVVATDLVSIDFDLQAIPYAAFATVPAPGLELRLNALNMLVTLYSACADGNNAGTVNGNIVVGECTPLYSTELDMDAKMLVNFGLTTTALPEAVIADTSVNIIGDVVKNTFLNPTLTTILDDYIKSEVNKTINKSAMLSLIPGILASYVQEFALTMTAPITSNVDVKGLGLVDKSAWLVLQDFEVDAAQEFVLLTATIEGSDPTPLQAFYKLSITDSCETNPTIPVSLGCPGYVAP